MEYSKIEDKLGDWGPKLRPFIESKDFDDIFKFLKEQSRDGKVICPESKDLFRSFEVTPYKDLKAIFLLQDPYPWIKNGKYVADGIPMSCSHTGVLQPSLELFYAGMEDDLGRPVTRHPDLSYLSKQGVLFLNTNLTVELNKPSSHSKNIFGTAGLWDKFMNFLIEEVINFYNCGLVYVSLGNNAHVTAKAIVPFIHWGFEVEHPAAAAHKEREWNHQNVFSKINKIIKNHNNEQINWIYGADKCLDEEPITCPTGVRGKTLKE